MKAIILGKSGTGKSTVQKILMSAGFKPCVSHTTRPKRANEIEGIDYFFVSNEEFENASKNMIVKEFFPAVGWYYGKLGESLKNADIIVTTPGELPSIENFLNIENEKYEIFYLTANDITRRERSINRGDSLVEIDRRISADNLDFLKLEESTNIVHLSTEDTPDRIAAIIASSFTVKCIKYHKELWAGKEYQIEDLIIPMKWKQSRSVMFTILNELGEVQSYSSHLFTID